MIHHPPPTRTRRWRLVAATLVVGVTTAVAAVAPGTTSAARRTQSESIAVEATRGLDAFARWHQQRDPADYVRFVQSREAVATMTASELEVDAGALRRAWATAETDKQHAVLAAMSQLGVPYRSLASEPGVGFDCSGLTSWAFAEAGIELPRVSGDQIRNVEAVDRETAEAGDLVYYPGHIGIYLGAEVYVHSPNPGNHVEAVLLPERSLRFGDPLEG